MDEILERGVHLFNNEQFFECHEVLEILWTAERGPRRLFLQALIHFAVAFHHDGWANPVGAGRQLGKGLRKLSAYLPACEGIDTARLHREGLAVAERMAAAAAVMPYPKIHLVAEL
jgi:predicted metal-dependent hydrolase